MSITEHAAGLRLKLENAPCANEHADRVRRRLYHGRNAHYGSAEEDGGAPAEAVGHVGREGVRGETADVLHSRFIGARDEREKEGTDLDCTEETELECRSINEYSRLFGFEPTLPPLGWLNAEFHWGRD